MPKRREQPLRTDLSLQNRRIKLLYIPTSSWVYFPQNCMFFSKAEDFVIGPFPEATAATQATWKSCTNIAWSTLLTLDCAWDSCETKWDYRQHKKNNQKDREHSTFGAKGWSTRIYGEALCRRAAFAGAVCFKLLPTPFSKSAFFFHFQGRCWRCVGSLQCLKILKRFKLEVSLYTGLGDKKLQLPFNEVQPLSMSCFDMMLVDSPDILNLNLGEMMWDVFSWCKHIKLHV